MRLPLPHAVTFKPIPRRPGSMDRCVCGWDGAGFGRLRVQQLRDLRCLPCSGAHVPDVRMRVRGAPRCRYDSMLFVSPEYDVATVRQLVAAADPSFVALVVHNADAGTLPQLTSALTGTPWPHTSGGGDSASNAVRHDQGCPIDGAGARSGGHSRRRRRALLPPCPAQLHILALAPHVARHVAGRDLPGVRQEHVTWVLPVKPLNMTTTAMRGTGMQEDSPDRRAAGDSGVVGIGGGGPSRGVRKGSSTRSMSGSAAAVPAVTVTGKAAGRQGSRRGGKGDARELLRGHAGAGKQRFRRRARSVAVGAGAGAGYALPQRLRALKSVDRDDGVGLRLKATTAAGGNPDHLHLLPPGEDEACPIKVHDRMR